MFELKLEFLYSPLVFADTELLGNKKRQSDSHSWQTNGHLSKHEKTFNLFMLAAESSSIIVAFQSYVTCISSLSGKQLPGAAVQVEEGVRQSGVIQGNNLAAR